MAYNGTTVKDNWAGRNGRVGWRVLEEADRAVPKRALAVFGSLRPGLLVSIKNIYALVDVPLVQHRLFQPNFERPPCQAHIRSRLAFDLAASARLA